MLAQVNPRQTLLHLLPKNAVGAELGVWKGDFSQEILSVAQPKLLYLIDPWQQNMGQEYLEAWYGSQHQADMEAIYHSVCQRFQGTIDRGRVRLIRNSSVAGLAELPDQHLDYVYIDGDHTYNAVFADLEICYSKVRTNGLICGDDYDLHGWWKDGVVRAVNEFIGSRAVEITMVMGSQFVLRKLT